MDPVTHAALGAAFAASMAPSHQRRLSALVGGLAALVPDADALISSSSDPLLVLDYHRHFTHALIMAPVLALVASLLLWLLWPRLRSVLGARRIYVSALAGAALAAPLDACTSYGTHLWLPFSEAKVAWNLIAVFDPLFTLLLLIPLTLTLLRPQRKTVHIGLLLAAGYLALGYMQLQRTESAVLAHLAASGQHADRLTAKPTLGNLLLWRAVYAADGQIHAVAVHAGPQLRLYAGASATLLADLTAFGVERHADIERIRRFSDDWLVALPNGRIGDGRYAMLPTDIAPIWGIEWNAADELQFVTRHAMTPEQRRLWIAMLFGCEPPAPETSWSLPPRLPSAPPVRSSDRPRPARSRAGSDQRRPFATASSGDHCRRF